MKAIAVINKMPKDCDECPFVNENRDCILLNEDAFPNDWVEDAPYYSLKEKGDCPLRPLPKKKTVEVNDIADVVKYSSYEMQQKMIIETKLETDKLIALGWNACLKEIIGEKE